MENQDINLIKQVTTLVADLKNLKESQEKFHIEMKDSFKELKENYSGRLDDHEARLKAIEVERISEKQSVQDLKNWIKAFCVIGVLVLGILIFHLTGYHI